MAEKKMEVSVKVRLKVKDVEIELTMQEAADLCDVLSGIVDTKEVVKYVDRYPAYYPWRDTGTSWPWTPPHITWTCDTDTTFATTISNDVHVYACTV